MAPTTPRAKTQPLWATAKPPEEAKLAPVQKLRGLPVQKAGRLRVHKVPRLRVQKVAGLQVQKPHGHNSPSGTIGLRSPCAAGERSASSVAEVGPKLTTLHIDSAQFSLYDIFMPVNITQDQLDTWVSEAEEGYDLSLIHI